MDKLTQLRTHLAALLALYRAAHETGEWDRADSLQLAIDDTRDEIRDITLRRRALYIIACGPAGREPAWSPQ
jgi:hypothetical protein